MRTKFPILLSLLAAALAAAPGCASASPTPVRIGPIEVEPIHVVRDVVVPPSGESEGPEVESKGNGLGRLLCAALLVSFHRALQGNWPQSAEELTSFARGFGFGGKFLESIRSLELVEVHEDGSATHRLELVPGPEGEEITATFTSGVPTVDSDGDDRDP